ncbi:hypothetical protein EAE99_005662 [Botrytis elliptica]|nr:hypothetical protein EAE99_005662 [Botrytis elliptica]
MSESNKALLACVCPCWIDINAHFQRFRVEGTSPFSYDIENYCLRAGRGGWNLRMNIQLQSIHIAAYILNPLNFNAPLIPSFEQKLEAYIRELLGELEFTNFLVFRRQSDQFNITKPCWETTNSNIFWEIARHDTLLLSKLALDLLTTTANSVPSERAFFCMNFIQIKL